MADNVKGDYITLNANIYEQALIHLDDRAARIRLLKINMPFPTSIVLIYELVNDTISKF